jgi:hypothetical protein
VMVSFKSALGVLEWHGTTPITFLFLISMVKRLSFYAAMGFTLLVMAQLMKVILTCPSNGHYPCQSF